VLEVLRKSSVTLSRRTEAGAPHADADRPTSSQITQELERVKSAGGWRRARENLRRRREILQRCDDTCAHAVRFACCWLKEILQSSRCGAAFDRANKKFFRTERSFQRMNAV
jgi:hypothetical protein